MTTPCTLQNEKTEVNLFSSLSTSLKFMFFLAKMYIFKSAESPLIEIRTQLSSLDIVVIIFSVA